MLLAEPYAPMKEPKKPFSNFLAKTRRAIINMRNRKKLSRELEGMLLSQPYMLPGPPLLPPGPQPPMYCCYGGCFDPYVPPYMLGLPPPPMHVPFPPPQMHYIYVYLENPMDCHSLPVTAESSPTSDFTLYSRIEEKEQVEKDDISEISQTRSAGHFSPGLSRRHSDIIHNRPSARPFMNYSWSSVDDNQVY